MSRPVFLFVPTDVTQASYDALTAMTAPYGWSVLIAQRERSVLGYRAWMAHPSRGRMYGSWMDTPQLAVDALIRRVEPLVPRAVNA